MHFAFPIFPRRFFQRAACRAAAGFTLMELVIVTALIAVLSGAIVPVYVSAMNGLQLRNSRDNLVSAIRFAQEMAVRESREYRVYLDAETNQWWVMRLAGVEDDTKVFEPADHPVAGKQALPPFLELDRARARRDPATRTQYIACLPNGASDEAVIILRDTRLRGARHEIEVEGPLGRVSLKERR